MKAVTAFLVACALVLFFFTSPALAEKGRASEQPQTLVRDVIPEPEPGPSAAAPTYQWDRVGKVLTPIAPGTYTIGATGATYPTITAAVQALQLNGVAGGGTVYFEFIDPFYTDTCQTIGGYPGQSSAAPVVFRPAPATVVTIKISPLSSSRAWGFRLDNAAGVTFDGSNSGGTDRSLTVVCDTVMTFNMNAFLIQRGSQFVTIKNLIAKGNRRSTGNGSDIIRLNNYNTTPAATAPQHDITIDNCWSMKGVGGLYIGGLGSATVAYDYNIVFTHNLLGGAGSGDILDDVCGGSGSAIYLAYVDGLLVDHNEVYGATATTGTPVGIRFSASVSTATITNNKIHDIKMLAGTANRPFFMLFGNAATAGAPIRMRLFIANNMFYDMHNYGAGTSGRGFEGFIYNPTSSAIGMGTAITLVNNTFAWMNITAGEGGPVGTPGTCFIFDGNYAGTGPTYDDSIAIYNNIAATNRVDGYTRTFLVFGEGAPGMLKWYGDHNLFYQNDLGSFAQLPTPWPSGVDNLVVPTLADWSTNTGNDLNSKQGDPVFVSPTDVHVSTAVGDVSAADSLAIPWAGITTDIDGDARDANKPDAGADEFLVTRFVNDLAAKSVDFPTPTQILAAGAPFSPMATFVNPGTTSYASAPVSCEILDGPTVVYTGTATIAIGGYDHTAQATFAPAASLPAGSYTIRAIANLPGDQKPSNDVVTSSLFVQASISSFPYNEGFESGPAGWLTATPGGPNDWVIGTPAKVQISHAHSGSNCWVTKTTGTYSPSQESYLFAPILNLTSFTGMMLVEFYLNSQTEYQWDGLELQISLDGGFSWTKLDSTAGVPPAYNTPNSTAWYNADTSLNEPNIYPPFWSGGAGSPPGVGTLGYAGNSAGWVRSSTVLNIAAIAAKLGVAGPADLRLRFHFFADAYTEGEGCAIDDVTIKRLEPDDIGIASLTIPGYVGGPVPTKAVATHKDLKAKNGIAPIYPTAPRVPSLGALHVAAPLDFTATVRNFGANAQVAYNVSWEISGVNQGTIPNTDPLPFGSTSDFTLTWAVPDPGIWTARAWTVLPTDTAPANDTSSFAFEVLAPSVIFYEGFNGTWPPAGWTLVNADTNSGLTQNWYQDAFTPQEGAHSAGDDYQSSR